MPTNISADLRHDTLKALRRTRQVREFADEPISDDQIDAIVEAGRWSGSALNRQAWTFTLIRDHETKALLGELAPRARGLASAPLTIAIGMRPGDNPEWDPFDEGRASERMMIAATAVGLSASVAWVQPENRRRAAAVLGLSEPAYVRTLVSVGHPSAAAAKPKAPPGEARKPRSEVVREA